MKQEYKRPKKEDLSAFEDMGYSKYDSKPSYITYGLMETKDGWAVIKTRMTGLQVCGVEVVKDPDLMIFAKEAFRLNIARYIINREYKV